MDSSQLKPIIAVDIDDVLAANAEGFIAYSNRKWGTNLKVEDYDEHWEKIWDIDIHETRQRSIELHADGIFKTYQHNTEAKPVLHQLAKCYELIVVTSRRKEGQQDTIEWLDLYFKGIFKDIHFAGLWDNFTERSVLGTKAALCQQIGASYLIDDQLKHCLAVAEEGIEAILFGDYKWNQISQLPERVTRCNNWHAVQEYFNGR